MPPSLKLRGRQTMRNRTPPPLSPSRSPPLASPRLPAPVGSFIHVPDRLPIFPDIYEVETHPQRPSNFEGRTFVLYGDFTAEGHIRRLQQTLKLGYISHGEW
jgi:hypothetical protein